MKAVWSRRLTGIMDAGVSSLGNLGVSVVAARNLSLEQFGLVSVTMLVAIMSVGASRALWGDPLILEYAAESLSDRREAARRAMISVVGITAPAAPFLGLMMMFIATTSGAQGPGAMHLGLGLAAVAPFLILHELMRQAAYCMGKPFVALLGSVTWTTILFGILFVLNEQGGSASEATYVLVWGLSAFAGMVVVALRLGIHPGWGRPTAWIRQHSALSRKLLIDFSLTQVSAEGSIVLISVLAGAAEAGLIRKAQIPLAPLVIMTSGLIAVAQPALVRRLASTRNVSVVASLAYKVGAAAVTASLTLGAVVWLLPAEGMRALVGGNWDEARRLVPLLALYLGLGSMAACQGLTLRAIGALGAQVRLRMMLTPIILLMVACGALLGAMATTFALCLSLTMVVIAWARLLQTSERVGREDPHVE